MLHIFFQLQILNFLDWNQLIKYNSWDVQQKQHTAYKRAILVHFRFCWFLNVYIVIIFFRFHLLLTFFFYCSIFSPILLNSFSLFHTFVKNEMNFSIFTQTHILTTFLLFHFLLFFNAKTFSSYQSFLHLTLCLVNSLL